MATLHDIQRTVAPELEQLNGVIDGALRSPSALMQSIVNNYLKARGKQLRPMLVLLTGRYFGGITPNVISAGAAIELLHNASLIHDDVIDRSDERRGIATINSVWTNHMAVLVGDFFISSALKCVAGTQNFKIINSLATLGAELSLGEVDQFDNARSHDITEKEYFTIIRYKTASLFRHCIEVGGYANNAPEQPLRDLTRYAELLGLCFQIKDDTFDYFDDPAIGKPTGNDLREGKVTLPLIHALDDAAAPGRNEMLELVRKPKLADAEIERLVNFAKDNGGIDYANAKMQELRREAYSLLDKYEPNETIEVFKQIFDYVIERKV